MVEPRGRGRRGRGPGRSGQDGGRSGGRGGPTPGMPPRQHGRRCCRGANVRERLGGTQAGASFLPAGAGAEPPSSGCPSSSSPMQRSAAAHTGPWAPPSPSRRCAAASGLLAVAWRWLLMSSATSILRRPAEAAWPAQIEEDQLTKVAKEHWRDKPAGAAFDAELVKRIYDSDLHGSAKTAAPLRTVMLLEVSLGKPTTGPGLSFPCAMVQPVSQALIGPGLGVPLLACSQDLSCREQAPTARRCRRCPSTSSFTCGPTLTRAARRRSTCCPSRPWSWRRRGRTCPPGTASPVRGPAGLLGQPVRRLGSR